MVRLGRHDRLERSDRLVVAAILEVDLREVHVRADVAGVELAHFLEELARRVVAILGAGDEAEHVGRLRR